MKLLNKMILLTIIIIIIIIIVALIFLIKESKNTPIIGNEGNVPQVNIEEVFNDENKIQLINTKAEYFNIKSCIDKYSKYSNVELNNKSANGLISIIPDFVKNELGLTENNVTKEIGLPNKIIRIDSIYKSLQTINTEAYEENTNVCAYVVKGTFIDKNSLEKQELKMIIILDFNNNTFLVVPQKYIEQKKLNLEANHNFEIYTMDEIQDNSYNTFIYSTQTAEDMAKEYFNRFKDNLTYDLEYIYNCLDAEYRQKRFGNFDKFKEYINDNKKHFNQIQFNKYMVNYDKEYIEYVCKDQYENLYIFKETSPMNFSLKLDTYTIQTEKFKSEYQKVSIEQKVRMNTDKWVQMLNNRDYSAAYNLLDETFKNNNFDSKEKFKSYMKQNLSSYYKVEFLDFSSQADIYVQKIKLTDITNERQKDLDIIMQLKEGTDFVMSFSIK